MPDPLLTIRRLSKHYAGVRALEHVDLDLQAGQVHALCGENGAGKSTLIKILGGVISPDQGMVTVNGVRLRAGDAQAATDAGIAVIHQESTAFPDLNAVQNIFVGRELRLAGGWLVDWRRMKVESRRVLKELGQSVDLDCPVEQLSVAQRQMISIARAISQNCGLLILDEPTASLSPREIAALIKVIHSLRDKGVGILYVSHRLDEIFEFCDRVTVLRDGVRVACQATSELNRQALIRLMVGRDIQRIEHASYPAATTESTPRLEVDGLTRHGHFQDISFRLHAGEIVGLAGLVGAGRSEVARCLFGIDQYDRGEVRVDGAVVEIRDVKTALQRHIALVPEDRQHQGLLLPMTVQQNLSLAVLTTISNMGWIDSTRERRLAGKLVLDLDVRTPGLDAASQSLSGGNQQKLVLGKWLASQPRILLLDEPTRGVDVAAKAQVHSLVAELAGQGMATLLISSDISELLETCDRILVMSQGRITGELPGTTATEQEILNLAFASEKESAGN